MLPSWTSVTFALLLMVISIQGRAVGPEVEKDVGSRSGRQIAETDQIDVDGPYGYVPRVVHGVNKIVKGLLNGSVHEVFHGAFGIAPDDVAEDLVGTYNRIMGIPDPEDIDEEDKTTAKPKPKPTQKTKVKGESGGTKVQGSKTEGAIPGKTKPEKKGGKRPLESKVEEDDDYAVDEDDDDEEED